jgi:predicted component of type VI protein secretion system
MIVDACVRCNAPLRPQDTFCPRCGLAVERATGGSARAVLTLRQVAPTATSETWEIADDPQQIGRVDGAIRLVDRTVSRRHARISPSPDGFMLEDLGSSGGTYINDRQITAPTPIHHGDRLGFGDVVLAAELRQPLAGIPLPPTPVHAGPAATLMYAGEARLPISVASRSDARTSLVDATIAELPASTPPIKIATTPPRARRKVEAADPPVKAGVLMPLGAAAEELARSLRTLERDVAAVVAQFDQSGGVRALDAVLARLRQASAGNPASLVEVLPDVCRFLEIERALIEVLRPEGTVR